MAKTWRGWTIWRAAAIAAVMLPVIEATALDQGTRVTDPWRDPATGVAIGGYDPVAYYTDHAPREGESRHELTFSGVTWRFDNAANREVFARDPDVYAPRFGARDPSRLAEGYEADGNPLIWLIEGDRLYLFASFETRERWIAAPDDERARAEANWPGVVAATQ